MFRKVWEMACYGGFLTGHEVRDGDCLTDTGLLLADALHKLRSPDLLIMLAYGVSDPSGLRP